MCVKVRGLQLFGSLLWGCISVKLTKRRMMIILNLFPDYNSHLYSTHRFVKLVVLTFLGGHSERECHVMSSILSEDVKI